MTGAEIVAKIIQQKGMDGQERVLLKTLSLQMAHTLNPLMQRKAVRCKGIRKLNERKPVRVWAPPAATASQSRVAREGP